MPRKKKTDDIPAVSHTETASTEANAAEVSESAEDVKAEIAEFDALIAEQEIEKSKESSDEAVPDNDDTVEIAEVSEEKRKSDSVKTTKTSKKKKTRKKADETEQEEEVSQPSEEITEPEKEKEENSEDSLNAEDLLADIEQEEVEETQEDKEKPAAFVSEEDVFPDFADDSAYKQDDVVPEKKEKSAVELAEELKNMRMNRVSEPRNSTPNYAKDLESTSASRSSNAEQRQDNDIQAAEYYGFSRTHKDLRGVEESLMWSELRRLMYAGISFPCRVIAAIMFEKEMCAVCQPTAKKYSKAFVYVPFSEMDIPSKRVLTTSEKRKLIEKGRLNVIERVRLTRVEEKNECIVGSIRIGNRDARKAAFFRGTEGRIVKSAEEQYRNIIGKGTITIGYVQHINKDSIIVNIFGAPTRIKKSELSYRYVAHPKQLFAIGQPVEVKILDIQTSKNNDYSVSIKASIKRTHENETIKALNDYAVVGHTYLAEVALLPSNDSNLKFPMAYTKLGFNCSIGGVLTNEPYTEGSIVSIKLSAKNKQYAYGHIVEVKEYTPNYNERF